MKAASDHTETFCKSWASHHIHLQKTCSSEPETGEIKEMSVKGILRSCRYRRT